MRISAGDHRYPRRLRDLGRPPDPVWVEGDVTALSERGVAIVGTRRMTGYGERVAREIAGACAAAGIVVVSGLAQGIDASAHRGALDAGGRTIAVLGEGIDLFVSSIRGRRRPLVSRIRASGALVSEYAPAFCAKPWTFVKRNATIAALAEAVVVVEAGEESGALITADDARRLGRPLFAVPGPLGSSASIGTNALIASGSARAVTSPAALLEAIGAETAVHAIGSSEPILDALAAGPLDVDALARRAGGDRGALDALLVRHLLEGTIALTPDGRYRRV